jgi:metallo-beta-lactamase family protein
MNNLNNNINIHFLGDAVTGSKYLLETPDKMILIDCGQFREPEDWTELKWLQPAVKIQDIDLVLFPCAHSSQNHILPKLVERGFKGRIISAASMTLPPQNSAGNRGQTDFWPDSKWNFSRRPPASLPDLQSMQESSSRFRETPKGVWVTVDGNIRIRFQFKEELQEHIFIELDVLGERLFLTGDIGHWEDGIPEDQLEGASADEQRPGLYAAPTLDMAPSPRSTPESSFWLG